MRFEYCFDCNQLDYAVPEKGQDWDKSYASNHYGHRRHLFKNPTDYSPPIRRVLIKLDSNLGNITDNEAIMFALALELDGIEPNVGA